MHRSLAEPVFAVLDDAALPGIILRQLSTDREGFIDDLVEVNCFAERHYILLLGSFLNVGEYYFPNKKYFKARQVSKSV